MKRKRIREGRDIVLHTKPLKQREYKGNIQNHIIDCYINYIGLW